MAIYQTNDDTILKKKEKKKIIDKFKLKLNKTGIVHTHTETNTLYKKKHTNSKHTFTHNASNIKSK